ncbi:MAG: hypothetical protein SOW25_00475 [Helicobacter sp.]|nr:hypothetical protein [Helicobacter sp.]
MTKALHSAIARNTQYITTLSLRETRSVSWQSTMQSICDSTISALRYPPSVTRIPQKGVPNAARF